MDIQELEVDRILVRCRCWLLKRLNGQTVKVYTVSIEINKFFLSFHAYQLF